MAGKTTVILVTANVGSIFEEPSIMLKIWTQEFLSTISRLDPKFVALHCQEVGGKNYEKSMRYVEDFVKHLVDSDELRLFDKARIYLDEDFSSAENFTALGNFYFIHESITDALIFDFEQRRFVEVDGKVTYSQNIENIRTKEKSKFPLEYFPECKWSRKGFLRTRWCLNGTIFDLVNIHLFHDVSNFVAIKSFPSVYCDSRRRALVYTLERFQTDEYGPVPLFLFGDFNFRTDTQGVVKHLSKGLDSSTPEDEVSIIQFKQEDKVILSLGKKQFSHSDHQAIFTSKNGDWLREFDKELEAFSDQLFEFKISFPPSYPFEENSSGDRCYMKTRCPAWCDRVILSHSAIPLVKDSSNPGSVVYGLMGRNTCMGDHKPVYLSFEMKSDTAKEKWEGYSSRPDSQEKFINGVTFKSSEGRKRDNEKTIKANSKYSEIEIEKLACSLEALMSQNSNFSQEVISNIEPDLSRCPSCRIHQSGGKMSNSPGGEEVSRENFILEDEKIIGLLASEIKVPADILQKIEIQDTGQRNLEKHTYSWEFKINNERSNRYGLVKRVNSASFAEQPAKKEDWKNSRCNSDVSWSPASSFTVQTGKFSKGSKQFSRGSSRIRLISSSNSLNISLPRLTSHHSSSDEEWFEEIEEKDDDVLRMNDEIGDINEKEMRIYPDDCEDKRSIAKSISDREGSVSVVEVLTNEVDINRKIVDNESVETVSCITDLSKSEFINPFPSKKSCDNIFKHQKVSDLTTPEPEPKKLSKTNKTKPLSILKRLTEVRKDLSDQETQVVTLANSSNRESFETLVVDPIESKESGPPAVKVRELEPNPGEILTRFGASVGDTNQKEEKTDVDVTVSTESWETIELGGKKSKDVEKHSVCGNDLMKEKNSAQSDKTGCCCVLQ